MNFVFVVPVVMFVSVFVVVVNIFGVVFSLHPGLRNVSFSRNSRPTLGSP